MTLYNSNEIIGMNLVLLDGDIMVACRLKGSEINISANSKNIRISSCVFEDTLLHLNQPNASVVLENNYFINTGLDYKPFMRWLESKCQ